MALLLVVVAVVFLEGLAKALRELVLVLALAVAFPFLVPCEAVLPQQESFATVVLESSCACWNCANPSFPLPIRKVSCSSPWVVAQARSMEKEWK